MIRQRMPRWVWVSITIFISVFEIFLLESIGPMQELYAAQNTAGVLLMMRPILKNFGKYRPDSSYSGRAHSGNEKIAKLMGHVPKKTLQSVDQGLISEDEQFSVTVALELNHEAELDAYLQELYDPKSPHFMHYLTTAEFIARYSPTEEQVAKVRQYLQQHDLEVQAVDSNRLLLHVKGRLKNLNALLNSEVHQFKDKSGRAFFAPAYEFQVPEFLGIRAIHGLDNVARWHTHHRIQGIQDVRGGTDKRKHLVPEGGLTPIDIQTAYNLTGLSNGAGQVLALFELDGYDPTDIQTYAQYFRLPNPPLQNIIIDGATSDGGGGTVEVTLDIELMLAVAPNAASILVYQGPNTTQGVIDTYNQIANDNKAKIVSTSWGMSEDQLPSSVIQSESGIFKQMAAQGQTIYAAAGDSGAYDDGSTLGVDDPASQPYITGVGGTTISVDANSRYVSEKTWSQGSGPGVGGGGGVSSVWPIPDWQKGVISCQSKGSSTMRNVPDVALNADPATGYAVFANGGWTIVGGTSCAAPLWAAYTAVVNQTRTEYGHPVLGYMNPWLYQLGQNQHYESMFHDIRDGSTNGYYPAVTGYDDATGWGSFDGNPLYQYLIAL